MAYYYKVNDSEDTLPLYKGFHLQKVKKIKRSGPKINYDFSKHVLIELLDDTTPEADLWSELGLINNDNVIHKRMMIDSHRIKCRRAIVICINSDEAKQLAHHISQTKVINRCVCAVVIQDLLSDLCLFERQLIQFGDSRPQQQLLYVFDLSRCRGPSGLIAFLKETFSSFGTILSVLVSSDNDGYAFPEGVIKFAYLSEAFAAELAFDQYVIGKERLSVTTHHNVLLSQCDLRVRLRDAQWCNNVENNTSSESLFKSCNQTYEQNDFCYKDPVVNSMNNLQISLINDNSATTEILLPDDKLEFTLPAFSQYNFKINTPNEQCHKNASDHIKESITNRRTENKTCFVSVSNRNFVGDLSNDKFKNTDNSSKSDSMVHSDHKISIFSSDTIPIDVNTTKDINHRKKSHCCGHSKEHLINSEVLPSHIKKSNKITSDSESFVTCNNFSDTNSNSLFSSSKKTVYNSLHTNEINSASEYQTVSSDCKQFSSSHDGSFNGSVVPSTVEQSLGKKPKKRRKKFTPSLKLCLKSQRAGLSQSDFQSTSAKGENSVSSSSQPEKRRKRNKLVCKNDANLRNSSLDSSRLSKVVDWLSNIPVLQSTALSCDKEESVEIEPFNEKSIQSKNKCNRISVHGAPSIKSNLILTIDHKSSCSDDSSLENQDPNKNPLILSDESHPVPLMDESISPLQTWLKHELMSSTNNRAIRSQDTFKSIVVCATKTKDVIIAVGCSYMTCDSCYLESTDLLLGYN